MKVISIFITCIFSVLYFLLPTSVVRAQDNYLRVISSDTPFYKNIADDTPLFYLPYTYYVKVLTQNGEYTHVEVYGDGGIPAIDGFVPTYYLFEDGLNVENPFVVLTLTTTDTAILYADPFTSTQLQYLFPNRQLSFYGTMPGTDSNLYLVGYNGKLGYVKENAVYPFSIPNHPNELTFIVPEAPSDNQSSTPENMQNADFLGLKIAIIVCLVFAGIIALFVALKIKPQKSVAVGFYDDNDYE